MAYNNDLTIQLLSKALDAAAMRQMAIANNIANVKTQGYQPLTVDFAKQLDVVKTLMQQGASSAVIQQKVAELKPKLTLDPAHTSVKLDEQMALMTKNSVEYQALIKGIQKKYATLSLAINTGGSQ